MRMIKSLYLIFLWIKHLITLNFIYEQYPDSRPHSDPPPHPHPPVVSSSLFFKRFRCDTVGPMLQVRALPILIVVTLV